MKTAIILLCMLVLTGFTGRREHTMNVNTYTFGYENVLGTSLDLKVTAVSAAAAEKAEETALHEIDRLDNILSSYKPGSEFNRWQQTLGVDVKVSPELFEVLNLFDQWKSRTAGAINPSVGVAATLWKNAEHTQMLPLSSELEHAVTLMDRQHWSLTSATQSARHLSTAPLLLNSFVKSYIVGKAAERIMAVNGITGCVVNIGGDMVISGDVEELIRVTDPKANEVNEQPLSEITLSNNAIATSGNYRRGYAINNNWYSHILDVRTGLPSAEVISATVIAHNPADAGALATAFNILTIEESRSLAREIPGVAYQIVTKSGKQIESEGWKAFQVKKLSLPVSPELENGQYELTVEIELARFQEQFRRPFVAVWVENSKKESVRSLALWYNKPRWLPDLKRWYSKNRENIYNTNGSISSISSATRSPGRYTLKWDGRDDEGNMVSPGKYTIYIEAAREHGTYQLISQQIEWNGQTGHFTLKGGVEITSASLDIHAVAKN